MLDDKLNNSSKFRGYDIIKKRDGSYIFVDNGELVSTTWHIRPCGFCGKHNTPEGHDGCLGIIPNVMNACCGHGITESAYIQFESGSTIRGEAVDEYVRNCE